VKKFFPFKGNAILLGAAAAAPAAPTTAAQATKV